MLCPNCEAENRESAQFCDECGFPLTGALARGVVASPNEAGTAAQDDERFDAEDMWQDDFDPVTPYLPDKEDGSGEVGYESFPTFDYPGTDDDDFADARADAAPSAGIGKTQPMRAFDKAAETAPKPEERAPYKAVPQDEDPFAGYSRSIDEQEYGFRSPAVSAGTDQEADVGSSEQTSEMPRVDEPPVAKSRDFRMTASQEKHRVSTPVMVIAGIVVGVALAALVTFLLGFWGGVAVPDVTGMTESDARTALEEEGFTVRSTQVKSDDTEGLVLVMDPAGGSRAGEGSEVVIHISTARFIPEIVDMSEAAAKSSLEESGYENVRYEKEKSEGEEGIVLSVSPEAGTRAKSNAEVVVMVSEAYRVPDVSGLDLDGAAQAIAESGLTYGISYVDSEEYEDGTVLGTSPEAGTQVEKESFVSINVARRRGAELVALTQAMFAQGQTVNIGGVDYEIESLDSVVFAGNDVVSFTATALPRTTFFGKTIYADEQVVSGQVVWSENNEVIAIS